MTTKKRSQSTRKKASPEFRGARPESGDGLTYLRIDLGWPAPWHVAIRGRTARGAWKLLSRECLASMAIPGSHDGDLVRPWLARFGVTLEEARFDGYDAAILDVCALSGEWFSPPDWEAFCAIPQTFSARLNHPLVFVSEPMGRTQRFKIIGSASSGYSVNAKDAEGKWRLLTSGCVYRLAQPGNPDARKVKPWLEAFGIADAAMSTDSYPAFYDAELGQLESAGRRKISRCLTTKLLCPLTFSEYQNAAELPFGWSA